jgi:glycosyltransferase involved in cell wall biosynthesis
MNPLPRADATADATGKAAPKIVFVIDSLGPGGAERSLAEMLPGFLRAGINPVVVCLSQWEGIHDSVRGLGVDVRVLNGRGGRFGRLRALRELISAESPDCVHTTLFESDVAGRLASAGRRIPVITSLVNVSYDKIRLQDPNVRRLRLAAARMIDGWTARHLTHHFHAVTQAVKRAAVESLHISPDRVTVIERGRDPARLGEPGSERRRSTRARLGLADDAEIVINVGRAEFQKGQRFLLEAMARLAGARPEAVLLVAGREGHASRDLEQLTMELGLGDRIRFLGHRDDVPDLLAAADLFVFPSLYEGLGGSLIEAMALGLPVVTSDLEAIREVVDPGHNAVLVPPGSAEALAAAIGSLLDDRARRAAMGSRSREIFHRRFRLDRATGRMVDLYSDVLRRHGRPVPIGGGQER